MLTATSMPVLPAHVPTDLVRPFPFGFGMVTERDPFNELAAEMHNQPEIFFAEDGFAPGQPAWVVRRAADLRELYFDTEHFSSKALSPFAMLLGEDWRLLPVEADPPQHSLYRAIANPLFTPRAMSRLEDGVRRYVRDDIAKFRDKGACEVMTDFAFGFPIKVFLEMMGLPLELTSQFLAWEMGLVHSRDIAEVTRNTREVVSYLRGEIDARSRQPSDDLISYAMQVEVEGRTLSKDELLGFIFNLFLGGLDTVSTNVGLHFRHLAEHPADQAWLRANPEQIPTAIDELMRAYGAVTTYRTCTREIIFKDVRMLPGDKVAMSTTLAGRDPQEYEQVNEVILTRKPRHLSFGYGPHMCVGMQLARREMRIAMEEFLAQIPEFRIKPGHVVRSHLGMIQPEALPLVWQEGSAAHA